MTHACRNLVSIALLMAVTAAARADNWPQWRGPTNNGICSETGLPTKWSTTENIAWTLAMPGSGASTPAIWGDRLFITSEAGSDIIVLAISTSGKELWRQKLGRATPKARIDEGNGASASISTDGKHLWAFSGSGELACYDLDGKQVWIVDLQKRYGKFDIQFGMHSTPVLHKDRLYLQLIHSGAAVVAALNKETGEGVWKVERLSDGRAECEHSYASPVIWTNGTDEYLITHGNDYAIAHRLSDGQEIWRVGGLNPKDRYNATLRFVASPVATPELIVIPTAKKGPVVGLKPNATGAVNPGSPHEQWRMPKNTPDVPSPLVHDGIVYLVGESGTLICLDAKTGQEHYNQKLFKNNVRHRASPVFADGKIYVTSRDEGTIHVVKAGPKYELLATNKLPDIFAASPAISNGRIYLRGFKTLCAIGGVK